MFYRQHPVYGSRWFFSTSCPSVLQVIHVRWFGFSLSWWSSPRNSKNFRSATLFNSRYKSIEAEGTKSVGVSVHLSLQSKTSYGNKERRLRASRPAPIAIKGNRARLLSHIFKNTTKTSQNRLVNFLVFIPLLPQEETVLLHFLKDLFYFWLGMTNRQSYHFGNRFFSREVRGIQ